MSSVSSAMRLRLSSGMCLSVRMLCSRSASLTRSTRTSSAMASRSLRRFSACSARLETRSSFLSLVRPSTSSPISLPNSFVDLAARRARCPRWCRAAARRRWWRRRACRSVRIAGDFERMREIRIARGALLRAVRLHRIDIGAVEQRLVGVRIVAPHPLHKLVLSHQSGPKFRPIRDPRRPATFRQSKRGGRRKISLRGRVCRKGGLRRPRNETARHEAGP